VRAIKTTTISILALGLLAGSVVGAAAQSEEAVTGETLFELTVPSEALPEAAPGFIVEDLTVVAGADVSEGDDRTSQANEAMRARALLVESGELLVEPTTDALLWREEGVAPEVARGGVAVRLTPGEAIFLPSMPDAEVDSEKHMRIANPGSEDAMVRSFHAHAGAQSFGGFPEGISRGDGWFGKGGYPRGISFDGVDVLFRLTRWTGEPGAALPLVGHPALAMYYVESGTLEETTARGPDGTVTDEWMAERHYVLPMVEGVERSLLVAGEDVASVLELVAIPQPE